MYNALILNEAFLNCRSSRYVGPFTFNTDTLERVDFAGGYFDGKGGVHFYHTDWQGNVTMVADGHGQLEQHIGYYPYGEPWREPKGQHSRLFAGKERFEGLAKGTSDFGPRHHYPALAQWTGIDRLGHRNPRFNTYVFCGANPIKNIDPSGNDYFIFNTTGHLISREPDKDEDVIAIRMHDEVIKESKPMKAHSIQSVSNKIINYPEKGIYNVPVTTLKIKGDNNSDIAFRFLAENSDVEFTHVKTGKAGPNAISYITSSHEQKRDASFGDLYLKKLQFGYTLRSHTHNHPSGNAQISEPDSLTVNQLSKLNNNLKFYLFVVPTNDSIGRYIRYFPTTRTGKSLLP